MGGRNKNTPSNNNVVSQQKTFWSKGTMQNIAIALLSALLLSGTVYHIMRKTAKNEVFLEGAEETDDRARDILKELNEKYDIPQFYTIDGHRFDLHNIIFKTHHWMQVAIHYHDKVEIPNNGSINTPYQRMMLEPRYAETIRANLPIVKAFMNKHEIVSEQDIINFMSGARDKYEEDANTEKPPALVVYLLDTNKPYIGDCNDMAMLSFCMAYILRESGKITQEWSLLTIEITKIVGYNSPDPETSVSGHIAIFIGTGAQKKVFDPLAYENAQKAIEGGLMGYPEREENVSGIRINNAGNETKRSYKVTGLLPLSHAINSSH